MIEPTSNYLNQAGDSVVNFTNTASNATLTYGGGTRTCYPAYTYGTWGPTRTLKIKLSMAKSLSIAEYYEHVNKLMLLLKDTPWDIISTKTTT